MKTLAIPVPEGLPQALKMLGEEFRQEARRMVAVKLYESGRIFAGIAAQLIGTDGLTL